MKTGFIVLTLNFIFTINAINLFSQALFQEKVILEDFYGATCIVAADFDLDNDIDFAVTAFDGDQIGWFENDGSQNFTLHQVVSGFDAPKGISVGKFDANDSWDIVSAASGPGKFSWFSNDGSGNFTEHIIADTGWIKAGFVYVSDIDSDSDDDIVLIACDSHKIGWAENDGAGNFEVHLLKENWTKANSATVLDIDKDNDMDIIATAKAGQIIWFVNDGLANFTERILFSDLPGANSVQVCDFDHDGDMDMVATACDNTDQVAWYENNGNFIYQEHILKDHYDGARASKIADIDQDGDTDIVVIAWQKGIVNFFENDGTGNFTERVICDSAYDMINLFIIDLDLDNDLDILGTCYAEHEIRWWESMDSFLVPDFQADSTNGKGSLHVKFTDRTYSKPGVDSWSWDFDNDGIPDSDEQHPQHYFDSPGYYTVRLTVTNDSTSETIEKESFIRVFDKESSIELNGSDSRIKCNNDPAINLTHHFSFEAWIKPFGFGESGTAKILDKTMLSVAVNQTSLIASIDSCIVVTMVHSNGTTSISCTPDRSVRLNEWQHIAMTYNDSTSEIHIFLNGVDQPLQFLDPPSGSLLNNSTREIYLGNSKNGNQAFHGCLDEIRLWNIERTADEIRDWMSMNLIDGQGEMAGYWKIDEIRGDTIFDRSGWLHHGVLTNARWAQGYHLNSLQIEDRFPFSNQKLGFVRVFPNPFNTYTTIEFAVSEMSIIDMRIIDINGRLDRNLVSNEWKAKGDYKLKWDGKDNQGRQLPAGLYTLILSSKEERVSKKIQINN